MQILSPVFQNMGEIPARYTCDGKNINPPLLFSDIPDKTKSLVLIVDDPDAVSKVWVHWIVFNIDPKTQSLPENSVPKGSIQGSNDSDQSFYMGPCPPSGVHNYFFKLYALDTILNLPSGATKEELEKAMRNHILEKVEIIGLYQRGR